MDNSIEPVVVSFSLFEIESIYDVVYIQSCTLQGVCEEIPSKSWGTGVSTQEIALLTGPKMANPTKIPSRMLVSTTTVRNRLCGPNVKPQCLAAYGGYIGPSIPPPYEDFSETVNISSIVLRNHPWGQIHENYESIYATNVNVHASSQPTFQLSTSVKCAGPITDLWWTRAQMMTERDFVNTMNTYQTTW